jgi:hypothetical protein
MGEGTTGTSTDSVFCLSIPPGVDRLGERITFQDSPLNKRETATLSVLYPLRFS